MPTSTTAWSVDHAVRLLDGWHVGLKVGVYLVRVEVSTVAVAWWGEGGRGTDGDGKNRVSADRSHRSRPWPYSETHL